MESLCKKVMVLCWKVVISFLVFFVFDIIVGFLVVCRFVLLLYIFEMYDFFEMIGWIVVVKKYDVIFSWVNN